MHTRIVPTDFKYAQYVRPLAKKNDRVYFKCKICILFLTKSRLASEKSAV